MRTRTPSPLRSAALASCLLGSMGAGPQAPSDPKPVPVPVPVPATADSGDPAWEEQKLRAREDADYLEALHRAKQAECREAELRVAVFTGWKLDLDRQKQKGLISPFQSHQGEMLVAENQSQMEMRRAERKDAEIRLARARRRLKAIERSPSEMEKDPSPLDERLRELESKIERIRTESERTHRISDAMNKK